ncbi:MFS general substrate transporter [Westerdykella ornata]|uniref:MFS general substrate transporter n=1 Tax=Westerdykella ornata TaxID=318751 RepID=A0A6A6J9G3_WESOR|nr:MFS general substrate transporter [Westerdykella ornata]KAF2273220.1 MFS general substrate transporter [Westerdykella ornata]
MDRTVVDHSSRGSAVLAVTVTTLACCTVFVVLRLISRFVIVRRAGLDDYLMILAWVLAFGTSFSICYGTSVGLGRHERDVPLEGIRSLKKAAYAFTVLYNPALMAIKSSILVFYLTLSRTQKIFRRACFATLAVVITGGLALTVLNIFQCRPIGAAFQTPVPDTASCTNIVTIYLSSAPLNIITDLAILVLPMPLLTSMHLPRKQKGILVVTFGFGFFVAIVDIVRMAYLQDAARDYLRAIHNYTPTNGRTSRNNTDYPWYISFTFMWSAVELNVGIMCGCVPALKPLVSRFMPTWILDRTVREKSTTQTSESLGIIGDNVAPDVNIEAPPNTTPDVPPAALVSKPSHPTDTESDEPIDVLTFLTTPETNTTTRTGQSTIHSSVSTARANRHSMTFYDFVENPEKRKKNITLMGNRESIYPIMMVTILFFVWGFAYGLLDTLNTRFQQVARMRAGQNLGLHAAYYGGYFIGPLTFGRIVFRHWGFKACYTVGLTVYACGTLVFWPSAVLTSFTAFLISNFIVGLGLSTLEISANPFIALCGPPEYAEARLNMSQAIQAIGTILSPLLASKVMFKSATSNLIQVQWAYLGIAFFTVALAVVYIYVPLPEATEEEMEDASKRLDIPRDATVSVLPKMMKGGKKVKIIWITLGLAVFSQFAYVGAQESVSTSFTEFVAAAMPSLDPENLRAAGHTAFAVSRFLAAILNIWIKPRFLLAFFYAGVIALSAACMAAPPATGATPTALLVMLMFFEGPLFPLIFVQPLRGMGMYTKEASALLTAAIGGGAAFAPIMYAVVVRWGIRTGYAVPLAVFAAGAVFAVWQNGIKGARGLADPVRDERAREARRRERERERERRAEMGGAIGAGEERRGKRRSVDAFKGWLGWEKKNKEEESVLPTVEHKERVDSDQHLESGRGLGERRHSDAATGLERSPSSKRTEWKEDGGQDLDLCTTLADSEGYGMNRSATGHGNGDFSGSGGYPDIENGGPIAHDWQPQWDRHEELAFQTTPAWLEGDGNGAGSGMESGDGVDGEVTR